MGTDRLPLGAACEGGDFLGDLGGYIRKEDKDLGESRVFKEKRNEEKQKPVRRFLKAMAEFASRPRYLRDPADLTRSPRISGTTKQGNEPIKNIRFRSSTC